MCEKNTSKDSPGAWFRMLLRRKKKKKKSQHMIRSCSESDVCKGRQRIKCMPVAHFFNADIDENGHGKLGFV